MHEQYGDDVTFVEVAGRADVLAISEFIDTLNVRTFEHAIDDDGSVLANYAITTRPSFVSIDENGTTPTHVGALGVDGLSEALNDLRS